jgi:glycolate oxidase
LNAITQPGLVEPLAYSQQDVVQALLAVLPAHCVLSRAEDTRPFECDGLSLYRSVPMAVVLPETESQIQEVLIACRRLGVPFVARCAGTGCLGEPCRMLRGSYSV